MDFISTVVVGCPDRKQGELTVRADDLVQAFSFSYAIAKFGDGQTSRTEMSVERAVGHCRKHTPEGSIGLSRHSGNAGGRDVPIRFK